MGFFDGVAQGGVEGASMVLYISRTQFFHLKMGCVSCSNTKVELLALLGLLYVASTMGLAHLLAFGDSIFIIEWVQSSAKLQVLELEHWGS